MKKSLPILAILVISLILVSGFTTALAQSPRVMVVLFFSPTCGHCHKVMSEDLPPLQEKYGEQLQIYTVDTINRCRARLVRIGDRALQSPRRAARRADARRW